MNRSANTADSTLGVTVKITKAADGNGFVAQAAGKVGEVIGPIVGRNECEAMNLHSQAVNKANAEGKL